MIVKFSPFVAFYVSLLIIFPHYLSAQAEYRTKQSGDWTNPETWEVKTNDTWEDAKSVPSGTRINSDWTIRSGHTIVLDNTMYLTNLTLESDAILNGSDVKVVELRVGAGSDTFVDNVFIKNNGTIESHRIGVNIWNAVGKFTITGNGTCKIAHLRARGGNLKPLHVIIDQDIEIIQSNTASNFTAFTGDDNNQPTDDYTFTINDGKTVKITSNTPFHLGEPDLSSDAGNYTYNINGVLDLGKTTRTTYIVPVSDNKNSTITLNVNGTLKLGRSLNTVSSSSEEGKVIFNVKGQVDKSNTKDLNLGSVVL